MKAPYRIEFDSRVKKDLKSVSSQDIKRIKSAISERSNNPRPTGCTKLKGNNRDYFRIRVGNYRIVYSIEDDLLLILVVRVGHRKEIYRNGINSRFGSITGENSSKIIAINVVG